MQRMIRMAAALLAVALGVGGAMPALAQVAASPDVTKELGLGAMAIVTDEDVVLDDGAGGVLAFFPPSGLVPEAVDIVGFAPLAGGDVLIVLDASTSLPGVALAEPRDVVRYSPATGTFSLEFDGSSVLGVTPNLRIDAVSVNAASELLLSFDTTSTLPFAGFVADEDIVRFTGVVFSMELDASSVGVPEALDLDGAHRIAGTTRTLVSFDTSGSIGGVSFDDEDVLEYDSAVASFALVFDGSLSDPVDWPAADLVALPEPSALSGLAGGFLMLAAMASRRR